MRIDINLPLEPVSLMDVTKPNKSTGIIGGLFSGINDWNNTAYPQNYAIYKKTVSNFWTPSDINMLNDIKQFPFIEPAEQVAYFRANTALSKLDSLQTPGLLEVLRVLTDCSFSMITAVIASQEAIHNESYSYLLSSIVTVDKQAHAFDDARKDPLITERNKQVVDAYNEFRRNPTPLNLFKTLVQSVILEGIFFYAGFAFFYFLASKQKMMATATMISYIQRDEMQHAYFITQMIRTLQQEVPELNTPEMHKYIEDNIVNAVANEKLWAADLLKDIKGIDLEDFNEYIEYLANKRFRQLGYDNYFEDKDNVMPWIRVYDDSMINKTKTDQFEQRPRSYTKVSEENGFDEL